MEKEQTRRILEMQHWQDLLEALQRESDQVDGWGEVTVRSFTTKGFRARWRSSRG